VSKHGGGATKKVLCCVEFRGTEKEKKRKRNEKKEKEKV
jgi:hypothetical protein